MTRLDMLFFDVGGVCLTNGWDTDARLVVEYLRDAGIKTWTERDGETTDANDHEDTA